MRTRITLALSFLIGCHTSAAVPGRAVAPYYYLGWGSPPDVREVMRATGVRWFTLAFVLDAGGCEPRWDPEDPRALDDARDVALIQSIRAQGGDVMISFGGAVGRTLEQHCESASALAAAYQKVIDTHKLTAIDVDIEGGVYADDQAKQRIVDALSVVRTKNPGLAIYITLASGTSGPNTALIERAAQAGLSIDGWSVMTFDWEDTTDRQAQLTMQSLEGLKASLMNLYHYDEPTAYRHAGISQMNGRSDDNGFVSVADMQAITAYAKQHQLARLTFWSVNRDRPCPEITKAIDRCSSGPQNNWDYTRAVVEYLK
jgi:hypothetical protein